MKPPTNARRAAAPLPAPAITSARATTSPGDATPDAPTARQKTTAKGVSQTVSTTTRARARQSSLIATRDVRPTGSDPVVAPTQPAAADAQGAADEASRGLALAAREMFAHSADAILTLDAGLVIQAANPAFARLEGWSGAQAQGRPCAETIRCRDPRGALLCGAQGCPADEALRTHGSVARELRWETRGGLSREVSATFTVAHAAEAPGAAATTAPQVVIVARGGAEATSAANRTQGNLISMISHELRTPLNTINGFIEIVLDGQVGPLNERQAEFLAYAQVGARQLMTLVEDILLISKTDAGQFVLRRGPVEIAPLIESALTSQRAAAERAQVRLEVSVAPNLPVLQADELRLQQALTNLLSNAIKFTNPGGLARVAARLAKATDGASGDPPSQPRMVIFEVSDTGRGIRAADLTRIFERFYQSENADQTRSGGHGLGLAIAKLIVEQHHGRIWATSVRGQGSTFSFTIPGAAE